MASAFTTSDRLDEYSALLGKARASGYALVSLAESWEAVNTVSGETACQVALRHDVDIRDSPGNTAFAEIESGFGAHATYYFRMSTASAHENLITRLLDEGFEVGYHYEEAASVAKRRHARTAAELNGHAAEIRGLFEENCGLFRARWNPNLRSVASHGDWINRRLRVANHAFVDGQLMRACGLDFEAYEPRFLSRFDVYVSDVGVDPASWANDYGLDHALDDSKTRICVLTHERRWHRNAGASLAADTRRAWDGASYLATSRWMRVP